MSHATTPWGQTAGSAPGGVFVPEPTRPDLTPSRPVYDGTLGELYAIYLRHLVLMIVTLGWSRFWGRTRIRRYVWNHLAILGDRLEYRGRGRELLIGFLFALVLLAAWAGLMYVVWIYVFHEKPFATFGLFDIFSLSVALWYSGYFLTVKQARTTAGALRITFWATAAGLRRMTTDFRLAKSWDSRATTVTRLLPSLRASQVTTE